MGLFSSISHACEHVNWSKVGTFAGGVLFGTAGIKILSSRDAKKAYTHVTAAAMRAHTCVAQTATKVRENCDDIVTDAKIINEQREAEDAYIEEVQEPEAAAEEG